MSKRYFMLGTVILILALANIWHWIGGKSTFSPARYGKALESQFGPEDFTIKALGDTAATEIKIQRDLFRPKIALLKPVAKKMVPTLPPTPPPKTPEQLEEEAARAELAQIKCAGVVFRNDKGQAFLTKGDQMYLAFEGDKVGERFFVEKITVDGVSLKDPKTNVSGQLQVSGK